MPSRFGHLLMQQAIGTEIIYSFILIACSLMVYFGTKELYELSSHKGIKYFRLAFLFFAIAYFFRSFIKLITDYLNINKILEIPQQHPGVFAGPLTLLLFSYFNSMAIFYLLYSVMWKKWSSKTILVFHLISLSIAFIILISNNVVYYLLINLIFLCIVIFIVLIAYKNSPKKGVNLYTIYVLLSFFWIFNMIDILIPSALQNFQLFIYLISSGIFLLILYKVLRKIGN